MVDLRLRRVEFERILIILSLSSLNHSCEILLGFIQFGFKLIDLFPEYLNLAEGLLLGYLQDELLLLSGRIRRLNEALVL